ncbi:hypothetical protein AB5I39_14325 [Sphingomonas sp. MMS24-J45]|uniref:hypothetical protein n=1 Tax=Sphingomonas sp. MMS24-J45 TaxID=3238806 RepID=UPI00384ACAD5
MIHVPKSALAALLAVLPASALFAQQPVIIPQQNTPPALPYADYADLVVAAPVVIDATIRNEIRLKTLDAPGLRPGDARLYIEADVLALIRAPGAIAARVGYTIDVPLDARGRPPRYRKARVLLFARGVPGNAGQIQLVRADGQRSWSAAGDALTRRIVAETLAPDAPPTITGIGNAFHTPGNIPGEGETRIFLTTEDDRPISIGIVRRTDQPRHWSVALGEVVGEGNPPPPRDTLLWYRLACTLPPTLPDTVIRSTGADAEIAREDYALVVQTLGTCDRGGRP